MKSNLVSFKNTLGSNLGKSGLKIKKFSPEILVIIGVGGIITSTVIACKATLKLEEAMAPKKEELKVVKEGRENFSKEEYTDKEYRQDLALVRIRTGVEFAKLYWPAITLGAGSICCIIGSHNIMKKRNLGLMAAYKTLEEGYAQYRKRIIEAVGEEREYDLRHGLTHEKIETEETDENGKTKKVKKTVTVKDPNSHSPYAKFFDNSCEYWSETPEYNYIFLKTQQNYANDKLRSQGHLFLNEVYDMLDIPRTQAGAVVGWVISKDGDNFVDFGLFDAESDATRRFINGLEDTILLDFNVEGVIYDLI